MKELQIAGITPQQKIAGVNSKLGNPGIKKQQGSTVEVYDLEQITLGKSEYEFFINTRNKRFPFTNLSRGVLQPQESFAMQRMYFTLITTDAAGVVVSQRAFTVAIAPAMMMGDVQFQIENSRVLKPIPLRSFDPTFNADSDSEAQNVYEFDTNLVIPPLLEFTATLRIPDGALDGFIPEPGTGDAYIACTIGGPGGIFAPKSNY